MACRRALTRQSGISLAELLVVVAVAMVLFGMAVPVMQNDDIAGTAARTFISDCVRARSFARRVWEPVTMQVDAANNRWRSLRQSGIPLMDANSDAEGWHYPVVGVDFKNVDGFPSDLSFLPNGRATVNAAMYIESGSTQWIIKVEALSARISATEVIPDLEGGS